MTNRYTQREAWLNAAAGYLRDEFKKVGSTIPTNIRLSCGFPSVRATANSKRRVGECWGSERSGDQQFEIMVSPTLAEPVRVLGILAHELCHATAGLKCGHKGAFRELAQAIGLEGKMTATTEGEHFKEIANDIIGEIGPYPHAELDVTKSSGPKKQTTRMIKCTCPECGYTVRTTRTWLDEVGYPVCPNHDAMEE